MQVKGQKNIYVLTKEKNSAVIILVFLSQTFVFLWIYFCLSMMKKEQLHFLIDNLSSWAESTHSYCLIQKHRGVLKKPVFKNFAIFTEKLKISNFIKKRLQHSSFPENITKFLKTIILKNICEQLLLLRQKHPWRLVYYLFVES